MKSRQTSSFSIVYIGVHVVCVQTENLEVFRMKKEPRGVPKGMQKFFILKQVYHRYIYYKSNHDIPRFEYANPSYYEYISQLMW